MEFNQDKIITAGYEDNNISNYWKDNYSSCYIAFKPFFKLVKRKDYKLSYGQYETLDVKIRRKYRPVKWEVIKAFQKFDSFSEIQENLFLGNSKDNKLNILFEEYNVIAPYESSFYPCQIELLLKVIYNLGYEKVIFNYTVPELFPSQILVLNEDNVADIDSILKGDYSSLYTEDNKILITNLPDQYVTLICSDKEIIELFVNETNTEGFYATEETNFYWSKQNLI